MGELSLADSVGYHTYANLLGIAGTQVTSRAKGLSGCKEKMFRARDSLREGQPSHWAAHSAAKCRARAGLKGPPAKTRGCGWQSPEDSDAISNVSGGVGKEFITGAAHTTSKESKLSVITMGGTSSKSPEEKEWPLINKKRRNLITRWGAGTRT